MRFFIDEDLSPALVLPCREAGYEATCSRDRGMLGMSDREVAALCLEEERVLVPTTRATSSS
jgi:predicted nuclease of predicted toxin-antitoxin system